MFKNDYWIYLWIVYQLCTTEKTHCTKETYEYYLLLLDHCSLGLGHHFEIFLKWDNHWHRIYHKFPCSQCNQPTTKHTKMIPQPLLHECQHAKLTTLHTHMIAKFNSTANQNNFSPAFDLCFSHQYFNDVMPYTLYYSWILFELSLQSRPVTSLCCNILPKLGLSHLWLA